VEYTIGRFIAWSGLATMSSNLDYNMSKPVRSPTRNDSLNRVLILKKLINRLKSTLERKGEL
jgi:hypothetical protein